MKYAYFVMLKISTNIIKYYNIWLNLTHSFIVVLQKWSEKHCWTWIKIYSFIGIGVSSGTYTTFYMALRQMNVESFAVQMICTNTTTKIMNVKGKQRVAIGSDSWMSSNILSKVFKCFMLISFPKRKEMLTRY